MNYRQWKKNYKKLHGYNPPVCDDKRKRNKQMAKIKQEFSLQEFSLFDLTKVVKNLMKTFGEALVNAGKALIKQGGGYDDITN